MSKIRSRFGSRTAVRAGATVLGTGLLVAAATPAFAAGTFADGSFEMPHVGGQNAATTFYADGSPNFGSWLVTTGSIDLVGSYWSAEDGNNSVDLAGTGEGAIEQDIATIPGHVYTITFWISGNPTGASSGSPAVKTATFGFGSNTAPLSFDTTNHTQTSMGWTLKTFSFAASGTTTPITFKDTTGPTSSQQYGLAIDNVGVVDSTDPPALPESPLGVGLFALGGMSLVGGAVGLGRRRHRARA